MYLTFRVPIMILSYTSDLYSIYEYMISVNHIFVEDQIKWDLLTSLKGIGKLYPGCPIPSNGIIHTSEKKARKFCPLLTTLSPIFSKYKRIINHGFIQVDK